MRMLWLFINVFSMFMVINMPLIAEDNHNVVNDGALRIIVEYVTASSNNVFLGLWIENTTKNDIRISQFGLWVLLRRIRFSGYGLEWIIKPDSILRDPADDIVNYNPVVQSNGKYYQLIELNGNLSVKGNEIDEQETFNYFDKPVRYYIDGYLSCADSELKVFTKLRCQGTGTIRINTK